MAGWRGLILARLVMDQRLVRLRPAAPVVLVAPALAGGVFSRVLIGSLPSQAVGTIDQISIDMGSAGVNQGVAAKELDGQ